MSRSIVIILLAGVLVACSSTPDAPLTADMSSQSTVLAARVTAEPTVTLPLSVPSAQASHTVQSKVAGTVNIDAQRPIPPDATLVVQLQGVNQEGVSTSRVLSEQRFPIQTPTAVTFELPYNQVDLAPPADGSAPFAHRILALLYMPGRVSWRASVGVDLQRPPSPVVVTISPPQAGEIKGSVQVPADPALPPDAVLTIRLVGMFTSYDNDLSTQEDLEIFPVTPGTIPFTLEYESAADNMQLSHDMHAEVRAGGKLLLSTGLVPAVVQGQTQAVNAALAPPKAVAAVTGTISYTAERALPIDARLTVEILDFAVSESPPYKVAAYTTSLAGPVPIPFALEYDPALIEQDHSYSVSVRIAGADKPIFDQSYSLPSRGEPIEIVLGKTD